MSSLRTMKNFCKICNYAGDTTIYVSDYTNEEIIRKLENDTAILSNWLWDNFTNVIEKYAT